MKKYLGSVLKKNGSFEEAVDRKEIKKIYVEGK